MSKKLYIGNLSFDLNEANLIDLFSNYGSVESAKIIADRETGRSRGFAFVEMSSLSESKAAINGLNGKYQDGRTIFVSEAKPVEPRENRSGFRRNHNY